MSLATNLQSAFTRAATEFKAIRTLISGTGTGDVSGLNTTATNLVDAINETLSAAGGSADLDDLGDVVITTPADGQALVYDSGTSQWVNEAVASTPADASTTVKGIVELATDAETTTGTDSTRATTPANVKAAIDARTASTTAAGIVELATNTEATTGTDTARAVTPAGVAAVKAALKDEILGAGVPAALDTLDELAAALGDDANFASTVTTSLAGKQPLDTDLTAIAALVSAADKLPYATGAGTWALANFTAAGRALVDDADAAAQRTTLDVYSKAEIGDPATDFVATFEAGLA
jgi:hypothetical protein